MEGFGEVLHRQGVSFLGAESMTEKKKNDPIWERQLPTCNILGRVFNRQLVFMFVLWEKKRFAFSHLQRRGHVFSSEVFRD